MDQPPGVVGTLDLVERDGDGRVAVVDLKTSSRKYDNLQVEASLQISVYSYATSMNGLGEQEDLRLRFDAPTKTTMAWRRSTRLGSRSAVRYRCCCFEMLKIAGPSVTPHSSS